MKYKKFSILIFAFMLMLFPAFLGCDDVLKEYTITVQNYMSYGLVEGSGTYLDGNEITIVAKPNNNSEKNGFVCWIHNFEIVSFDAKYTFKVNKETSGNYIAIFTMSEPALFTLESFVYTPATIKSTTNKTTELKNVQIYYSTNELSYTLAYNINEKFDTSLAFNTIKDFSKPFALLNTNDLYVKVIEEYVEISNDTKESTTKNIITLSKITTETITTSINSNESKTISLNKINDGDDASTLTFSFDYIDNCQNELKESE